MKRLFPLILISGFIYLIYLSGFTGTNQFKSNKSILNRSEIATDVQIKVLYATGKIPIKKGMPDTLTINLTRLLNTSMNLRVRIQIFNTGYDTSYNLFPALFSDTLIRHKLPKYTNTLDNRIVVEALPGSALDDDIALVDTVYDSKEYCQNITFDTYNYADPCLNAAGGFGFPGRKGNVVAGFRNKDSLPVIINSVEQKFFDSVGGGGVPYNIVIYSDNGSGKPGSLLYKSPNLTTPAGTGFPVSVKPYQIDTLISVAAGNRFYIGYRQTSVSSIKAAYQNEVPIRNKTFFFTSTDTGNVWYDFRDSTKNNRIDIAPIISNSELKINYIMQGFYNTSTNRLNMKDTISVFLRNASSPYAIVDSAKGKIDSVNFVKSFAMNKAGSGSYYIAIKHRNTIESWSAVPVSFTNGGKTSYSFITAASQAYGSNMIQVNISPSRYAGYSGDVNQDGTVDLSDIVICFNDASAFVTGYVKSDVTGDNITSLSDVLISYNNSASFISKITP